MSLIQDENRWMEERGRDMESGLSQAPAPCTCSPVWVRVGDFEVCTYVDAEHQQRCAEMQLRGWKRLGRPECASVRPANASISVPNGDGK